MGNKEAKHNSFGDSLAETLKLFLKAILKVALLISIGIVKIIHAVIGKIIEFIEKRIE